MQDDRTIGIQMEISIEIFVGEIIIEQAVATNISVASVNVGDEYWMVRTCGDVDGLFLRVIEGGRMVVSIENVDFDFGAKEFVRMNGESVEALSFSI